MACLEPLAASQDQKVEVAGTKIEAEAKGVIREQTGIGIPSMTHQNRRANPVAREAAARADVVSILKTFKSFCLRIQQLVFL